MFIHKLFFGIYLISDVAFDRAPNPHRSIFVDGVGMNCDQCNIFESLCETTTENCRSAISVVNCEEIPL